MFNANVWLLTCIQALAMSAGTMMVLLGGILGAQLAPTSEMSTLPVALTVVGTACGTLPVTRLMGRFGRKHVFIGAALFAALSSVLAAFAIHQAQFWLFLTASFCLGLAVASFQQIRFAAMESVQPAHMSKAASTVLLGGLAAAILGPELVVQGKHLVGKEYVGTFLLLALIGVICAFLFSCLRSVRSKSATQPVERGRLKEVLTRPLFLVAVSCSVVGYALMSFIMTATPVHMHVLEHHSLDQTKLVIQSHILAMYIPYFVSGWLIAKLGVNKVISAGICAYLLAIVLALAGEQWVNYWSALVLLGVGWNFLFLAGTVLLPQTHDQSIKFKVQGMHELAVFSAQALAALSAGAMLYWLGWRGLMFASLLILVCHLLLLLWQSRRIAHRATVDTDV